MAEKVKVSQRAILERIRRRLKKDRLTLKKMGEDFYIIDKDKGKVVDQVVGLERFARSVDCLESYEELEE